MLAATVAVARRQQHKTQRTTGRVGAVAICVPIPLAPIKPPL